MALWSAIERGLHDLQSGARILRHAPGLSAAAILLIALVIGGNATVYSMVNGILVSPASGVSGDDLVVIRHVDHAVTINDPFISFPNFEDYARYSETVTDLVGWSGQRLTLGTATGNFALFGGLVTTNYFDAFGVVIARGRGFAPRDDDARDGLVAVISHRLWEERFGLADDVVGRAIAINRMPATIVGVAARGFSGATLTPGEDLWLPIRPHARATNSADSLTNRAQPLVLMAGRLKPSASIAEARSEFAALSRRLHSAYPDAFTTFSGRGVTALQNPRAVVSRYSASALLPIGDMAPVFLAVFSVVTLLTLTVVCANVANLLLGRSAERQRDTAVRRSLGASRARIVRTLLGEGATLAITASAAAYVVAWWTSPILLRIIEPRPGLLQSARPDWTLAAYGMALALVATVACSVAPALRSWRMQVLPLLKAGDQAIARGRSRLSTGLVIIQFAFSVLLVTSAGLAYRSLTALSSGNLGFDPESLLLVTVRTAGLSGNDEPSAGTSTGRHALERVRERLAATAGIEAVSYARRIPSPTLLTTTPIRRDDQRRVTGFVRPVGPDYLRVLGVDVVAGRPLTAADRRGEPRVAVINQRLSAEFFAGEQAVGHAVFIGDRGDRVEIVGVVRDALFDGPSHEPRPRYLFVAEQQMPGDPPTDPSFLIRHRGLVDAVAPVVGREIASAEAGLPIVSMSTMNARLALVTELETMIVRLLACFAALSLVIAALGHYAVAMINMRRRTREFGVRMALGASPQRIRAAVIREALVHTAPGLALGLALSAAVAFSFRTVLFGVTPVDPVTYFGVCALLAVTSIVASYLPAHRASAVNVVIALREE